MDIKPIYLFYGEEKFLLAKDVAFSFSVASD